MAKKRPVIPMPKGGDYDGRTNTWKNENGRVVGTSPTEDSPILSTKKGRRPRSSSSLQDMARRRIAGQRNK